MNPMLGPLRVDLGPMTRAPLWPRFRATHLIASGTAFVFLATGAVFLVWRIASPDSTKGVLAAAASTFFLGIGLLLAVFILLNYLQIRRLTVRIHDNGLSIDRQWFRVAEFPWSDILDMTIPELDGNASTFRIRLRTGEDLRVHRLRLTPVVVHGQVVPHPDVRVVLDHYTAWQQRTHQPPRW